ncbi:MAG: hypothetical protein ABIN91_02585 [Mucilaginibacter sp.]|uniref:hypothetical protein n=1 Tax=Mucilaginibacter sp. TaxID=1882438 RepID=UPI0032668CDA
MKTSVIENSKGNNNNSVKQANPVTEENKNPQFVAGNPVNKDSAKSNDEAGKPEEQKTATDIPKTNVPTAELPKPEVKPEPVKPALNLEETLKLVAELNRRKIQRDKLLETIGNLEGFEVEMKEDADETDSNIYQGCTLTIEDDNRRKFVTKNPVIIFTVAQQVNSMCVGKLAEIEAGIILPA